MRQLGAFTIFGEKDEREASCDVEARAKIAPIEANITDVRDNWRPTGFYTPDQLGQALGFIMRMTGPAHDAIAQALQELQTPSHVDQLKDAIDALDKSIGVGGFGADPLGPFSAAVSQARDQGIEVIEAQGFKRTVLNVLDAIHEASGQLAWVQCMRPGTLLGVLETLGSVVEAFKNFIKAVGQVAKAIGQLVLKIPDVFGSFLTFLKFLPWVALAFGGYYVAVKTEVVPEKFDPLKLRDRETFKPWRKKA